jgi:hypothetical protein
MRALLMGILFITSIHAQPAPNVAANDSYATPNIFPKKTVDQNSGPAGTPSRQISSAELAAYVESVSLVFLSKKRAFDPFGQPQDPDAKPVVKKIAEGAPKRITPTLATPFPEIIEKIVVTTIIPREKCFLVGTQSFKQGDQVPLVFRGKKIRAQVTEVTSRKIIFLNLDSGESATRKLDLLPAGMTSGQRNGPALGMTQDRSTLPIELESNDSAP